ncbi:hypothetical protein BDA96_04G079700 [Sorghum bicolor]|uniref:Uncharacterized protein n=1 Tax=Sorghum bicolor TaxID=4558 RepID=A0A921UHD3_SORBI|nr:hypothetical protein BDA96_04G079700 [Sorghum bicolor]
MLHTLHSPNGNCNLVSVGMNMSMLQIMSPQQQHQLEVLGLGILADLFGRFRKQYVTDIKLLPEAC